MPDKNEEERIARVKKAVLATPSYLFWKKHGELLDELLQDRSTQIIFMAGIAKSRPETDIKSKAWYEKQPEKVKKAAEISYLFDEVMVSEIDRIKKENHVSRLYDLFKDDRVVNRNGKAVNVKNPESIMPAFQSLGNMLKNGGFWYNEAEDPGQKELRHQELFNSRLYTGIVENVVSNVLKQSIFRSPNYNDFAKKIYTIPDQMKRLEGKSEEAFLTGMKKISEDFSKAAGEYIAGHEKDKELSAKTARAMDSIGRLNFIFDYVQKAEKLENDAENYFDEFDRFLESRELVYKTAETTKQFFSAKDQIDVLTDPGVTEASAKSLSENEAGKYETKKTAARFGLNLYNALIMSITCNLHDHREKGYEDTNYPEFTDLVNTARGLPEKMKRLNGCSEKEFRQSMKEITEDFEKKAAAFVGSHEGEGVFTDNDRYLLDMTGRMRFIFDYIQTVPAPDGNIDAYSAAFDRFDESRNELMKETPNTEHLKLLTDPEFVKEKMEEKIKEKEAREQKLREAKGSFFRLAAKNSDEA